MPLVSAAIIEALGWEWVFWIVAIIIGFCTVLLFLFVPETFWDRTPRPNHLLKRQRNAALKRKFSAQTPGTTSSEQHNGIIGPNNPADVEAGASTGQEASFSAAGSPGPARAEKKGYFPTFDRAPAPKHESDESQLGYTTHYRSAPPKSFVQRLNVYSGRLSNDNWFRVAFRPFILFAYPSILWSAAVYALSVGWLIVLSESVSEIYRDRNSYNFTALQTGLVYVSPFVGGILGTAVAGKLSDVIVRFMSRRNGGVYEPEFRLVMAIPVALSTTIGLMGFGWSAEERIAWIVPTLFFGIISFGCSLGSTTAITFCVDSYRQYAGEALVTLNFAKNIFHGLVFSLFFPDWLHSSGAKNVFISTGGIQLAFLLFTIPMYIYGKRARMWTVRCNFMERF